ncbi:hypothetical protein BDZ89DRAFT_807997 [Hymenopellis radicata]|nr:hypothetical protein BDZ89DRAFT_807997 [Hymenopellis radicata]
MATTTSIVSPAPTPFDSPGRGADLVIITSDGTILYVVKAFLIYASPFFANLLGDSSPDETYENLPVYRSSEDCSTMCAVMRLCYPATIGSETTAEVSVVDALQKYMMEDAQERLKEVICSSGMMKTEPIKIFAIACRYRWADIARAAAKEILRIPLLEWENSAELHSITGMDYHFLQQYFLECSRASVDALSGFFFQPWSTDPPGLTINAEDRSSLDAALDCSCSSTDIALHYITGGAPFENFCGHQWLCDFILQARARLRDSPGADITSDELMGVAVYAAGKACNESSAQEVGRIVRVINKGLQAVIEKVELKLDF